MIRILTLAVAAAVAMMLASPHAMAATWTASSADELKALLPQVAAGDTIDLGSAEMGAFYAKRLTGVTLKGGVFASLRLDDPSDVVLDGGKVILPVNDTTARSTPAVLMYRATRVAMRNYDISTDRLAGFRAGYGIRIDNRGGGSGNSVEDTLIHDISSGIITQRPIDFVVRRVRLRDISADGFFVSSGQAVLFEDVYCDRFDGVATGTVHPDCLQVDEVAGPTNDLTIRNLVMTNGQDFAQGIFAGYRGNFRHANWTITGTRVLGITYRALSIAGVDGLTISDSVLTTPIQPKYLSMLTVDSSTAVRLSNNLACSHGRSRNTDLVEVGQVTAICRPNAKWTGAGADTSALELELAAARAALADAVANAAAQANVINAVKAAVQ